MSQVGVGEDSFKELCAALLAVRDIGDVENFLRDLCTPAEIAAMIGRWHVCRLLNENGLSYREIHRLTGVSLATIGRVARFLRNEHHGGYHAVLKKLKGSADPTDEKKEMEK